MKKLYTLLIICAVCAPLRSQTLFNKIYCSYSVVGDSIAMGFFGGVANDTTILLSGLTLDHTDTSGLPYYQYACFVTRLNTDGSIKKLAIIREDLNHLLLIHKDNIQLNSDQSIVVFGNKADFSNQLSVSPFYLTPNLDTLKKPDITDSDTNYLYRYASSSGVFVTRLGDKLVAATYKYRYRAANGGSNGTTRLLYFDTLGNFLRYGPEFGNSSVDWEVPYDIRTLGPNSMLLLYRNNQVCRLDSLGNVLWRRDYPGQFTFYKIRPSPDGHYVMAGEKYYYDTSLRKNIYEPYMMKVNSQTGVMIWDYLHRPADGWNEYSGAYKDITIDTEGNIYAVYNYDTLTGYNSLVSRFQKITPNGQLVWTRVLTKLLLNNFSTIHELDKIMPLRGGQFLLAGTITKGNVIQYGWLVKVDSMGQVMTITGNTEAPEASEAMLRASPNPSSGGMVVFDYAVPEQVAEELEIWVHDVSGRQVARLRLPEGGSGSAYWNTEGLSSGVYVYTLKAGGRVLASEQLVVH